MCMGCTLRQAVQNRAWGCWQPCQQGQKSAAQICAAVGSSKENRQRRLLTNMGWTMDCPGHAGKLVRGIGWRELGLSRNSAAKTLAACTQMRIRQRAAACASRWLDLARSETWTKDCPRHVSDSMDDAARAGSRGCQVGMQNVGSGSYGYPRSWDHGGWTWGLTRGCSQPTKDHGGENFSLLGR